LAGMDDPAAGASGEMSEKASAKLSMALLVVGEVSCSSRVNALFQATISIT